MSTEATSIKARERDAIIQALSAGVVPRTGLRYIQVGCARVVSRFEISDLDRFC